MKKIGEDFMFLTDKPIRGVGNAGIRVTLMSSNPDSVRVVIFTACKPDRSLDYDSARAFEFSLGNAIFNERSAESFAEQAAGQVEAGL